ncbi:MAG: hypothetical protein IKU24_00515 [Clostridia bacterium]|nr:hypothetical protein [Clostridia bacterium]
METKIIFQNGVNHIAVDGKVVDSLAFKSFRPTPNNVGDFYKAGVRIFHVYCSGLPSGLKIPYSQYGETWFGEGDYRFEGFDQQMEMFLTAAPDALFFINLHIDVRPWWLEENPGNVDSFTHLSQIAGNEKWKKDTCDYIKAFIDYAESKYENKILGYWLLGGNTTEWFSRADGEESHPVKLAAYRKYLGDPEATIPEKEKRDKPEKQIFLCPKEDREVIRYRKFHAELISTLVLDFCRAAKEALGFKKLVGVFFGYIMELRKTLWSYGHLDLDPVNESPYVDMIATPSSYRHRMYDDGTAHMILSDSLGVHGKAYFASFDNLTFLAPTAADNPRCLSGDPQTQVAMRELTTTFHRKDLLDTLDKTIHGMRREMMSRIAKRCGTWWFDMLEGWYYDDDLMKEVSHLASISSKIAEKERNSASEICVFVGSKPLYYVNPESDIHSECVVHQREALSQIGAPYDLFSMSDLERVDRNKYKLYIFLNAYALTEKEREYINKTLKGEGRSLLFVGPSDFIGEDGASLLRASDLLEMNLGILEKDEGKIRAFNSTYGYEKPKNPTLFVEDEKAEVLGRFSDSRKCALALREREDYKVFFSSVGNLSHNTLREIARRAGVHIFAENGIFTYINDRFLGVYNTGAEKTEILLKEDGEYEEIFSGKIYSTKEKKITLPTGECPAQMLCIK